MTDTETLARRLEEFRRINDDIWGEGNWYQCNICPPDSEGHPPFHHKDHHR